MEIHPGRKSSNVLRSNSINLFVVRFFGTVATFLVMYFYAHRLPESSYGAYQTIRTQVTFFSAFAGLGFASLVFTYSPDQLRELIKRLSASWIIMIITAWLVCAAAFAGMLQHREPQTFGLFFAYFLVYTINLLLESTLGAMQRFRLLPLISFAAAIIFFLLHFRELNGIFSMVRLFRSLLMLAIVQLFLYTLIFTSALRQPGAEAVVLKNRKEIRSLWAHLYFFEASQLLMIFLDKFVLGYLLEPAQFAQYFNATVPIPFLSVVFGAVSNASMMQLSATNDPQHQALLSRRMGNILATVAFVCFFFFLFFSREAFLVFFSEKYVGALPIFLVTILALPVRAYNYTTLLQVHHRGKVINQGVLLDAVLAVALCYPLYHWMGLKGIALAFVVATYIQSAFYLYQAGRVMQLPALQLVPVKSWILKFIILGGGIFLLHEVLKLFLNDSGVLLGGGIIIGIVAAVVLWKELKENF